MTESRSLAIGEGKVGGKGLQRKLLRDMNIFMTLIVAHYLDQGCISMIKHTKLCTSDISSLL